MLEGRPILGEKARAASDERIARGQELEDRGDLAGAEARFREAIAAAPGYARASLNLGNALHKQGRLDEAVGAYEAALALDARYAGAHFNLGKVLLALARGAEAEEHFECTLALDPAMADAAVMLGAVAESRGDLAGARTALERALAIAPAHAGAAVNLGAVLADLGDAAAARLALGRALEADPRSAAALAGLARLDVQAGHAREGEAGFRAALAIDAHDPLIWSSFLFSLNFRDDLDAAAVAREHFAFGRTLQSHAPARLALPDTRKRRLRVGYVSGDLMKHPIALFLKPVLAAHDRDGFEIFCYSNGGEGDEVTRALRMQTEHWREIRGREDTWVHALVRSDAIDVLVDLSGHTARNRLGVFARRAAPVQATWLGYLNTTGLAAMDYRICDRFTDPVGETEDLYSERLARLPASQWCYAPYYGVALAAPRAAAAPLTFGSFNQFPKLGDGCLDAWAEILARVPQAQLHVHGVPDASRADFLGRLERRGVRGSRVSATGRLGIHEYFAAIADVDIALDSMPYNGATTTLDTLWMGVPVVALRGARPVARGAYSIVSAAGLAELAAADPAGYVEANVRLAADRARREALARTLRPRLEASPLMDAARFTRDLESLYREMCAADPR